jgi:flagellar biosynthesis anti-sigma factor FlgM
MKISNHGNNKGPGPSGTVSGTAPQDKIKKSEIHGGPGKSEDVGESARVDVSDRAQHMQRAKELAAGGDEIDEAKVARLQKMIDDGNYKVDADAVADRLVDTHLLFPD